MALSCIHLFLLCAHHKQKHGVCPRQLQPSWCADVCVAVRAVNGSGSGSCRKTVILRVGCDDCATPLWRIQFVLDRRLGTTALVSLAGCMRYPQLIDSNRRAHYSKSWYSVIRGADLADGASYRRSVKPIRLRVSANLVSCLRNLEKKKQRQSPTRRNRSVTYCLTGQKRVCCCQWEVGILQYIQTCWYFRPL